MPEFPATTGLGALAAAGVAVDGFGLSDTAAKEVPPGAIAVTACASGFGLSDTAATGDESQRIMLLSMPDEASVWPSGEKATESTESPCPSSFFFMTP